MDKSRNLPFTEIYNLPNYKPLALQFKTEIWNQQTWKVLEVSSSTIR